MKNLAIGAVCASALVFASGAAAQSFTYDVVWEPVQNVGGMTGPDGSQVAGGGTVKGTYVTTFDDGTQVNGTVRCVGMRQPPNSLFPIHLACTTNDQQGTTSLIYGCNFLGKPGPETPLGCVGGIEGKDGDDAGMRGALTMHWYSESGARGTGQWYATE